MRTLLLVLLLIVPLPASAQDGGVASSRGGADLTARRDAPKRGCGDAGAAGAVAALESDLAALGGSKPPWRRLLKAGRPGCAGVAAWLGEGAPGAGFVATHKAIEVLAERGEPQHLAVAWGLFGRRSDRLDVALLDAFGTRLVALGVSEAGAVANHPSASVRRAALPLLVGHHSEGRWETVYGRAMWRERALHVAPEAPPEQHIDAVRTILQAGRGRGETAEQFADVAGRLLEEGAPGAEAWVELVLPLVELAGRTDQATANRAARALAWGAPDASAPLDVLVGDRRKEALSYYLDGLAARLRAKDDLDATLDALDRVAEAGLGAPSLRARRMHDQWSRKKA